MMRWGAIALFVAAPLIGLVLALVARRRRPRLAGVIAGSAVLLAAVGAYASWIEPRWLEVTTIRVESAKVERPIRIAVIADLQTDEIGDHERAALAEMMAQRPDLILFAGDYLQEGDPVRKRRLAAELRRALADAGVSAPLGVFAVRGDVETRDWPELFAGLPITVLARTETRDLGPLRLTGLDRPDSRDEALDIPPDDRFHVIFGHAPDFALGNVGADLLIAGHTHGGQVRLPLFGPLLTLSHVPRAWAAGVTHLDGNRTLIVSRGVGMERGDAPRLRFLCRPQLVIVDVVPAPKI